MNQRVTCEINYWVY